MATPIRYRIRVEFMRPLERDDMIIRVGRIPAVGEYLLFGDDTFTVHTMWLVANPKGIDAYVRVQ
jgi:hypothetical protein